MVGAQANRHRHAAGPSIGHNGQTDRHRAEDSGEGKGGRREEKGEMSTIRPPSQTCNALKNQSENIQGTLNS